MAACGSRDQDLCDIQECLLTLDIDWAPDWAVDEVASLLIDRDVRATWFVTHQSPAINRLRERSDLFELGIHPNCLPGTTHGITEDEVLRHVLEIVPEATSMRTHGLYQSSPFLAKVARDYGLTIDVSLFHPRAAHLSPHRLALPDASIWRVPYFWEDDVEMNESEPIWMFSDERLAVPGLKVFDFHPIHIVMNARSMRSYEQLKGEIPVMAWTPEHVRDRISGGTGPRGLFLELADKLARGGRCIRELVTH